MKNTSKYKFVFVTMVVALLFCGFLLHNKATVTYYAKRYNGRHTASGEVYSDKNLTCATTKKEFYGKKILLRNNDTQVIVRCNDLMAKDSMLRFDLTARAFKTLNNGSLKRGVMHLTYEIVED